MNENLMELLGKVYKAVPFAGCAGCGIKDICLQDQEPVSCHSEDREDGREIMWVLNTETRFDLYKEELSCFTYSLETVKVLKAEGWKVKQSKLSELI